MADRFVIRPYPLRPEGDGVGVADLPKGRALGVSSDGTRVLVWVMHDPANYDREPRRFLMVPPDDPVAGGAGEFLGRADLTVPVRTGSGGTRVVNSIFVFDPPKAKVQQQTAAT